MCVFSSSVHHHAATLASNTAALLSFLRRFLDSLQSINLHLLHVDLQDFPPQTASPISNVVRVSGKDDDREC